jgi:8-oxo-dGTP pyrophosphatase MutT (NUDIX family)
VSGRIDLLGSKVAFRGKVLDVVVDQVRLPDGREVTWEVVRHPGAAAVVPLASDGKVLLVRQSRHTVASRLLELPAGKLDQEGEDPAECARRELEEETGYRCTALHPLGVFLSSPGFSDEKIYLYLATGLEHAGRPHGTEEGDDLVPEWMDMAEALHAVRAGEIQDSKTALGLLLAEAHEARPSGNPS